MDSKGSTIRHQSVKASIKEIEAFLFFSPILKNHTKQQNLLITATTEVNSLKDILDTLSLTQRQQAKDLESQWNQVSLTIDPTVDSLYETAKRKIATQKDANLALLKVVLDVKKHHGGIKAGVEEMRKRVKDMIDEIG